MSKRKKKRELKKPEPEKELTPEERRSEVEAQILQRDITEIEKALIRTHQAHLILRKRAAKFKLEKQTEFLKSIIERLLWELYQTYPDVLVKHRGILQAIDMTEAGMLAYWKKAGRK